VRDRAKGTVAKPLDGGALTLVGNAHAGEGTHGGADTLSGHTAALWILRLQG
jgi:hypothetical protein